MRRFFSELDKLEHELVEMASLVKSSVHRSVRCLIERKPDFAEQVIRDEELVNRSEIAIDDMAIRLATLNQPVASDMRLLVAALKINTDLERMGDLAVNIARRALSLIESPLPDPGLPIAAMAELVEGMIQRGIEAFTGRNDALAREVLISDDQVDKLRTDIYEDLSNRMERDPGLVRRGLALMFVARNLERIADHATNIAEDVIFLVKGIDVRHHNEA